MLKLLADPCDCPQSVIACLSHDICQKTKWPYSDIVLLSVVIDSKLSIWCSRERNHSNRMCSWGDSHWLAIHSYSRVSHVLNVLYVMRQEC